MRRERLYCHVGGCLVIRANDCVRVRNSQITLAGKPVGVLLTVCSEARLKLLLFMQCTWHGTYVGFFAET